ncbi:MAG: hypothetical protein JW741_13535, partial [Sedimentisphaerales bacterium]|nr:hypothetical protein [Sedimentisphaerales bacterium]
MTSTCIQAVEKISEAIARKVGAQRYRIWFKNSTRLTLEEDYVKVGVPNLFIGGWIETHFADAIHGAVAEVLDRPAKVIFTIDPELFGGQRRRQLDSQAQFLAKRSAPLPRRSTATPSAAGAPHSSRLRHRLDNFVVGPSNQLAYSA